MGMNESAGNFYFASSLALKNSRRTPISDDTHPLPLQLYIMPPLSRVPHLSLKPIQAAYVRREPGRLESPNRPDEDLRFTVRYLACERLCEREAVQLCVSIPLRERDGGIEHCVRR